jgi:hypothetical protein
MRLSYFEIHNFCLLYQISHFLKNNYDQDLIRAEIIPDNFLGTNSVQNNTIDKRNNRNHVFTGKRTVTFACLQIIYKKEFHQNLGLIKTNSSVES